MSFSALSALIAQAAYTELGDDAQYTAAAGGAAFFTRVIPQWAWKQGFTGETPNRVVQPTVRDFTAWLPRANAPAGSPVAYLGIPVPKRGDTFVSNDITYQVERIMEQDLDETKVLVKQVS